MSNSYTLDSKLQDNVALGVERADCVGSGAEGSDEVLYKYLRTLMDGHDQEICTYTEITDDAPYLWKQNTYDCHTCDLVATSNKGICSTCAEVCHKDHNVC